MLAALFLLGVAAAAAAPVILSSSEGGDAGDDLDETPDPPVANESGDVDLLAIAAEDLRAADDGLPTADLPAEETGPEFDAVIERVLINVTQPLFPEAGDLADEPAPDVYEGIHLSPTPGDQPDVPVDDMIETVVLDPTEGDAAETDPALIDSTSDDPATLDGFLPGEEIAEITLYTELSAEEVAIAVAPSADGTDGHVTANEHLVVILGGAPDAGIDDITVILQAPGESGQMAGFVA